MSKTTHATVSASCVFCGWKQLKPMRFSSKYLWTFHIASWLASRSYDIHWVKHHMINEVREELRKRED